MKNFLNIPLDPGHTRTLASQPVRVEDPVSLDEVRKMFGQSQVERQSSRRKGHLTTALHEETLPVLLVVLDLDETLVHSRHRPLYERAAPLRIGEYYTYLRPGLEPFLAELARWAEIAIWSTGTPEYVASVVDEIVPSWLSPTFVWARDRCAIEEHCLSGRCGHALLKDLASVEHLGFDLSRTVIVDDTPAKLCRNVDNALYIAPYFGQADDDDLRYLLAYLESLRNTADVRLVDKGTWRHRVDFL